MEEIRQKKRRRRIIGFSILGGVVVLIIVLIVACSLSGDKEEAKEGEYKQVEKREIANSVSGNGKISAVNSEEITAQQLGGKVKAVYVKEGDTVSPGQVICRFDTKELEEQRNSLKKSIAEAKENKVEQDDAYERRVNEAELQRLKNIGDAETKLNNSRAEYSQALSELDQARRNYNDYMADPNHHAYDTEALQLQTIVDAKSSNVDYKKSVVDSYEATYDNLLYSNTSELYDARLSFSESSSDAINSLDEQVKEIDKRISESTVRCTIGGTVTSLNVKAGDTFTAGTVCTVEGLDDLMVEAEISEYDIPDVAVGMRVLMKTEATRDAELKGYVTYVAPKASGSGSGSGSLGNLGALSGMIGMDMSSLSGGSASGGNSTATFTVRISLNDRNPRLRLGMNAKISIITESVENALSVPIDSVQDDGNGGKFVEIATNYEEASKSDEAIPYEKKKVPVTTGIKGSYYTEIFGDVKVGDYVYVPAVEGADSMDEIMNMMGSGAGV